MTGSLTIYGQLYNATVECRAAALFAPENDRNEGLSDFELHTVTISEAPLTVMRETAWHEILECLFHENPALELALRDDLPDARFQGWIDALARGLREVTETAAWHTAAGCDLLAQYRGGDDHG